MMTQTGLTVLELCRRIENAVNGNPALSDIWVVGETSDLGLKRHCYFELVQKDERGNNLARIRAMIWANLVPAIFTAFRNGTGSELASGMKVLLKCDVRYSAAFGISLNVKAIDASYTLGEAVRRRREIIARLEAEGLTALQRQLRFPLPCLRIAIISGDSAAGYGDFCKHLAEAVPAFAFSVRLFRAAVQGERTVPEVSAALDRIRAQAGRWDCVVIIRGGGSTTDLAAFDSYELAAEVARFPIPVLVGIGHERDETVLDYVSYQHCKTPTAVAQYIIDRNILLYTKFINAAQAIYNAVQQRVADTAAELARLTGAVSSEVAGFTAKRAPEVTLMSQKMLAAATNIMTANSGLLDRYADAIRAALANVVSRNKAEIDSLDTQLRLLSPQATLARGFTLTLSADGHAVADISALHPGDTVSTYTATGAFSSTVTALNHDAKL